jgi:hypothetical protein
LVTALADCEVADDGSVVGTLRSVDLLMLEWPWLLEVLVPSDVLIPAWVVGEPQPANSMMDVAIVVAKVCRLVRVMCMM